MVRGDGSRTRLVILGDAGDVAQEILWMSMQGIVAFATVEPAGRPSSLTTWRHPLPVIEVPFVETVVVLDQANAANPAARLKNSFLVTSCPKYQPHSLKSAEGPVKLTWTAFPARTEDGFQSTAPDRIGDMNDWRNMNGRAAAIIQL
jgi:hypothetical protein